MVILGILALFGLWRETREAGVSTADMKRGKGIQSTQYSNSSRNEPRLRFAPVSA